MTGDYQEGNVDAMENTPESPSSVVASWLPSLNEMLIYGCFMLNVSTKGTIACFETLGASYSMTRFGLTSAEAGSTFATFGAIGVASLLSMRMLCRYFNDLQLVLGGILLMTIACLMLGFLGGIGGITGFLVAVFFTYSTGYAIGHTAVSSRQIQAHWALG